MAWLRGTPLEHEDEVLLEEKERHARLRGDLGAGQLRGLAVGQALLPLEEL